jgi:lipopolysaccharide/colanic/teichoic acid biosynthesis glycosyltransferase
MSLVGPRPMLEWEHALLTERQQRRVEARPGMTGLWQVSGRSDLSMHQMFELDLDYVAISSVWTDIKILTKTPFALLSR